MSKTRDEPKLEIEDAAELGDADWAQINKLRRAFQEGGKKALQNALADLRKNPVRYIRVMYAFFPVRVREALKDSLAEAGITEEDIQELAKKFEKPTGKQ